MFDSNAISLSSSGWVDLGRTAATSRHGRAAGSVYTTLQRPDLVRLSCCCCCCCIGLAIADLLWQFKGVDALVMLLAPLRLFLLVGLVTDDQEAARLKECNAFHIAVLDLQAVEQVRNTHAVRQAEGDGAACRHMLAKTGDMLIMPVKQLLSSFM
jgi:hypothetical protein